MGGARPPFHRQNIGKKINFWIKYAPNCRKMHLKFQRFLGGMPSDPPPQGRTPAISALPVYHPHPTPPLSKILDPRLGAPSKAGARGPWPPCPPSLRHCSQTSKMEEAKSKYPHATVFSCILELLLSCPRIRGGGRLLCLSLARALDPGFRVNGARSAPSATW